MKTLFESILGQDLDNEFEDNIAAEALKDAITLSAEGASMKVKKDILYISFSERFFNPLIWNINYEILNKWNIKQIYFTNDSKVEIYCDIIDITISCDNTIHIMGGVKIINAKFNAPVIYTPGKFPGVKITNTEFDANHIVIITQSTSGINKLSRIGYGKFGVKFKLIHCDQSIMNKVTENVTLKDILPKGMKVSAKYISIENNDKYDSDVSGGYLIADPKYKHDLEKTTWLHETIGTLKDGWLITQFQNHWIAGNIVSMLSPTW